MNEPIKVLQIFAQLNRGGAETNIMNYYRKIDRSKFHFDFVIHRKDNGHYKEEIEQLGGKIFRFSALNPFNNKAYKKEISDFFDANTAYKIIHGNNSEMGIYFYKEAQKRNIPVIIAHGHISDPGVSIKSMFRWYYKHKMRPYVNTYFACGNLASIWLFGKKNAHKAFIMNNAIDANAFKFDENKSLEMRAKLNCPDTINFLHVGRFYFEKNHSFMIDVFAGLLKINPNVKLFLVGEGELKQKIIDKVASLKISENVVFLGSRNDVNEIAQAMDYYLFPSLFEGLPVSLVEAQAAGLKCFISDGVPEESILISENVKVLSLKKSAAEWAKEIAKNMNHTKTDVSQTIIDKNFDINANVIILENKYAELLKANS